MDAVQFRYDYAKFKFEVMPMTWNALYQSIMALSHERKFKAEWLKSHHTNRLYFDPISERETWIIEIWGEWATIVSALPVFWLQNVTRLDVRANLWDMNEEGIRSMGQRLYSSINSISINLYARPARSKKDGRDAGGVGFAIGSHKSDLRVSCYKRPGEPCALEFQCSGTMLRNLRNRVLSDLGQKGEVVDLWEVMLREIRALGEKRQRDVFRRAGMDTDYPIIMSHPYPALPPLQAMFVPSASDEEEYGEWARLIDERMNAEPPPENHSRQ